jgi:CheY-like chemotaxis protein
MSAGPAPSLKVLVVDDDQCLLKLYEIMISNWKMDLELTCVDNVLDAMNYLEMGSPDLLILDMNLNGVDGREVIQYLQRNRQWPQVRVVVVSGMSAVDVSDIDGVPEDAAFMHKPIDFVALQSLAGNL